MLKVKVGKSQQQVGGRGLVSLSHQEYIISRNGQKFATSSPGKSSSLGHVNTDDYCVNNNDF